MNVQTCARCGEPIRPHQDTWNPAGLGGPVHKRCPEPSSGSGRGESGGPGGEGEGPPRPPAGGGGGGIILPDET